MNEATDEFDFLLLGVAELLRYNRRYPYPDSFTHALHNLALKLSAVPLPRTQEGLLKLFAQPVKSWCPYPIPAMFYLESGLVDEGSLSEEAAQYFYTELVDRAAIPENASTAVQHAAMENYRFRQLFDRLAQAEDRERAEAEYVQLRSFLIDNPYTTTAALRDAFWQTSYIKPQDVGALYDDWSEHLPRWVCDRCGPLVESGTRLRGVKPSLCNDHRRELSHVHEVSWEQGLRRVKRGVHWRVCLPGIPELRLFRFAQALHETHPQELVEVRLWPGIDRYDLQLGFGDSSIWAIDVKDIRGPEALGRKLTPLYREGLLRYDEGFYVVPVHRTRSTDGYLEAARYAAPHLPPNIHLLREPDFCARVTAKIQSLQVRKVAHGAHPL